MSINKIDLTFLDVEGHAGAVPVTKKPVFAYLDFDRIPRKCLFYVVDTTKCWVNGYFDSNGATISRQIPRSIDPEIVIQKMIRSSEGDIGCSGVYRSTPKKCHALQMASTFYIHDLDSHEQTRIGKAGDWIVFDGEKNRLVTESEFNQIYVPSVNHDFTLYLDRPEWKRDNLGFPENELRFVTRRAAKGALEGPGR